jgi:hypothetical protein
MTLVRAALAEEDYATATAVNVKLAGEGPAAGKAGVDDILDAA